MMTTNFHRRPGPDRLATALIAPLLAFIVASCGAAVSVDAEGSRATSPPSVVQLPASSPASPAQPVPTTRPSAVAATPKLTPSAAPEPARDPFALNLYRQGDFVAQYTFEWCVGASLQMALNLTTAGDARSRAQQQELWQMAQARSISPFGGANPRGWTAALNDLGIGPYVLVSIPDFEGALEVAAKALRETKRPVGLVMWRGRHAWVMSGFESIGDPALHDDVTVTGIRVLDPLYPHGSTAWGASPKPNALVTPATLAKQFVVRDSTRVDLGVPPGFLLVLPTTAAVSEPID